jgi:alpha-beta hydrolase superfamily lysophospholipase
MLLDAAEEKGDPCKSKLTSSARSLPAATAAWTRRCTLALSHGIGAHGGIYDVFCTHHAAKGVEFGRTTLPDTRSTTTRPRGQWTMTEWVDASVRYAEHVKSETRLPVFTLGSSLGVAVAYGALCSDAIVGAILMGSPAIPSSPIKRARGRRGARSLFNRQSR